MQVPNTVNNMNVGLNTRGPFPPRPPVPPPRPVFDTNPQSLPGYYVSSEDEIVPGSVPMDGSISFFPSKDLSRIFIRQWNKRGDLENLTYVLQQSDPVKPQEELSVPEPVPQEPQRPSPQEEAMITVLTSLNQGLANAFNQFGMTLQSMQTEIAGIHDRLNNLPDGGMG